MLLVLGLAARASAADIDIFDGQWRYDFALYGWLPTVSATLNFDIPPAFSSGSGGPISVKVEPSTYLPDLKIAAMFAAQVRKGANAVFTDVFYADIDGAKTHVKEVSGPLGRVTLPLNEEVGIGMQTTAWTIGWSHTFAKKSWSTADVAVGVRYLGLKNSLDWSFTGQNGVLNRTGNADAKADIWDGIVGVYGRFYFGEQDRWFIPYYLDIGAGEQSTWTWMAHAGIGYRFDWGALAINYKNLHYSQSGNRTFETFDLGGALIGVDWRW